MRGPEKERAQTDDARGSRRASQNSTTASRALQGWGPSSASPSRAASFSHGNISLTPSMGSQSADSQEVRPPRRSECLHVLTGSEAVVSQRSLRLPLFPDGRLGSTSAELAVRTWE